VALVEGRRDDRPSEYPLQIADEQDRFSSVAAVVVVLMWFSIRSVSVVSDKTSRQRRLKGFFALAKDSEVSAC
jgi:hypothetical protein